VHGIRGDDTDTVCVELETVYVVKLCVELKDDYIEKPSVKLDD